MIVIKIIITEKMLGNIWFKLQNSWECGQRVVTFLFLVPIKGTGPHPQAHKGWPDKPVKSLALFPHVFFTPVTWGNLSAH